MDLPLNVPQDQFQQKLVEKKANPNCPSCGSNNWTLPPEAILVPMWINSLPAPGVPASVMICSNCGFIRMHALKVLGLLPAEAEGASGANSQKDAQNG